MDVCPYLYVGPGRGSALIVRLTCVHGSGMVYAREP